MGLFKIIITVVLALPFSLSANFKSSQILYLIQANEVGAALKSYYDCYKEQERHDFELLQQLSLTLLDKGIKSSVPEEQLLAIYGAGVSTNEKAFYLLEEGLNSSYLQIQAVALGFLARSQCDYADTLINRVIASPHPLIRLEAAYQLALKKHPMATPQLESLMYKMGDDFAFLFPKLFATCGDSRATKVLKKLLTHSKSEVRCETILSLAEFFRDDLLEQIRKLAQHSDLAQQEVCAVALGMMKDEASLKLLKQLARSHSAPVRIAAILALNEMQEQSLNHFLVDLARRGNVFAIYNLKNISEAEECLLFLAQSPSLQIRLNASLALLHLKNPSCIAGIKEFIIKDSRDLAVIKAQSQGNGLSAFKAVPSLEENTSNSQVLNEITLSFKESILEEAINLPENVFLELATAIFAAKQNELIPTLCDLLCQIGSQACIDLLKKEQQRAGAPLIRNYCNLALVKLKEEGPYQQNLLNWVRIQQHEDIIKFRAYIPLDLREHTFEFELTPEETARLLISSFEILAQTQEDLGVNMLIEAMIHGNPKNRYVLAGLLLRITL